MRHPHRCKTGLMAALSSLLAVLGPGAAAQGRPAEAPSPLSLPPAPPASPHTSAQDRRFAELFVHAALAQRETAALAATRARDAQLRELAARVGSDYRVALARLRALAADLDLPPLPEVPDTAHHALLERLHHARAAAFDRGYANALAQDLEDQAGMLEGQQESGENEALKKFAADVLPMVREHRQRARQIAERLQGP